MWFTKLIPLLFLVIRTGSSERIPLRILTQLDSSLDSLEESQRTLIEGSLLPAVLRWVEDNIMVDPLPGAKLLIDRSCINDMTIKGSGFNKCIQGCVSNQQCGSHIIPSEHLGACTKMVGGITTAAGEGVDEEFILYVSAGECDESDPGNEAVQGKFCHSSPSKDYGRPTHGYMKFCTQELDSDVSKYEELVHKTLQRMLHILAFDKTLLRRYKDENGRAHLDTMNEISRDYDVAVDGEGSVISKLLDYLVLPTVIGELQSHFACDSIPGAQLESEDAISDGDYIYFEKLFFGNELMTAGLQGRGVLSSLTRAVLHDSGWYDLSSDFSEPLVWGKGAGCGFALKFCHEQLSFSEYSPEEVAPFCVEPGKSKCTADHRGYGSCNIGQVSGAVPNEYRNFDEGYPHYEEGKTTVGADVYADRCPYHQHDVMCTDITQQPQLDSFGEEYTGFSRCFDCVGNWTSHVQNARQQSSGCYPIECGTESYTVRVSKNTYTCTSGATIQVQNILMNLAFDGTLLCPDYDIVCAGQVQCTKDCHGNGKCVSGSDGEEDQCVCYPGYHGDNCDLTFGVDYCSAIPCQSGSTCVNDDSGSFRCECPEGKTGVLCHLSSSSCTPTTCLNNGRCEDRAGTVSCVCPPGFTGDKCQESLAACHDDENPCQNGAECFVDAEAENGVKCACPFSYKGVFCESVKNCDIFGPLACKNGGNCIIGENSYCDCPPAFYGHFCQIETCNDDSCNRSGNCSEDYEAGTINCDCNEGIYGKRCDKVDHCHGDPCYTANTARCINYEDGFECECYSGYTGTLCTERDTFPTPTTETPGETTTAPVDHCKPNPCLNGASCVSNDVTYFCRCTEEYSGLNCQTPRGVCYKQPCKNGGICAQGQEPSDFYCSCPDEWTGATCEEAVDPCELLDCINGGECIKLGNTASCSCPMGYEGTRCDDKANHCHSEPCAKDRGTCEYHPEHHNFTCHCKLGFMGPTCAEEMENSCELVSRCEHGTACVGSHDDYYCDCPEGLEGEFCEINPNDCVGNPCQRILFSRCQDLINGYECNCMPGFERRSNQCGDINECKDNPCLNGICINLPGKYRCMCRAGWTGTNCDIDKDECEAHGHKCLNGAQCVDLIADFRCDCVNHYTGQYCETAPPPCKLEPCQNGATCTDVDETNYRCNCPTGFEGDQCEVNIDECASDPCDQGTCVDGIADYTCECEVAYRGKDCDVYVGQCGVQPCANGAECVDLSASEFQCICPEFYTGDLCDENIDDCAGEPCANGGICNDGLGTFTCQCTDQWTGPTCQEDVNECEVLGICQNGGTCENTQGGFNCDCKDGFEGDLCETNTDDCVNHQCANGGVCVDDIAGYNCQCPGNYKGARCEIEVQFCKPDSCLNNGTCSVVDNVIQCDCSETGFEGAQCETEIDECVSQNVTCLHEGTCVDDILGYHCECHCAFTGLHCQEEVDFCANSTCSENTYMCISLVNSCNFQCQCQEGWDGQLCDNNIDECADNPCIHGKCTDGIAEYSCTCDEGYRGDNCEEPLDKCAAEPCKNGAACQTVVEGEERNFKCTCTPHYYGETCEEKHAPCYISPCGDHGLCQVEGENEVCACDDGFTGTFCETNIDDCAEDPCRNGASCHDKIMDFECDCQPGYGGKTCEALRDPCTDTDLCLNGAECSECVGEECERRYTCTCVPGFAGTNCETNIDECDTEPCVRGECVDLVNDYQCQCPVGYTDKNCETEIDECDARPCRNGQECVDQIGNYTCNCVGFTGRDCETDINECETGDVNCQNGGTCVNTHGSFTCDCPAGFGGDRCERTVLPCDLHGEKCLNMASCNNIDTTTQFQCNCTGGYSGEFCDIPSGVCNEENNPCVRGTCLDEEGTARCVCDYTISDGQFCEIELCQADTCRNDGRCEDTDEGFECTCNLPWVGKKCESKANVLQFKPKSRASIPLGEITEKEIRVRMGLKIKDMTSEQRVFEQSTSLGQLSLTIFDSMIQVTLEETRLELPIVDKFATVSVILVEDYLELMVGNQTEVSVFSESKEVVPSGGMQFGAASDKKRDTFSSYTGCLVDIGNIDIINMAEGEGFDECSDDEEGGEEIDNIKESLPPCENGGIRVGPYCQCMEGYRGDLCEIEIRDNCQSKDCPGDCRETSRGPQCVCSWPKEGELCTDLTIIPSFRADSSLVFEGDQYTKGDEKVYEFDLEINPEYPRGFIAMFEGSNGFCSMYLDGAIYFDCVSSEEENSVKHSQSVSLDYWSLVRISIIEDTMSISVDGKVELFSWPYIHDINLDGPITFGSIPDSVNITGTNFQQSSVPGFFGEIHPITLNNRKAKLKESVGFNVVSAKSRDLNEDYTSACQSSPCGEENTCYERARGHGCLCEVSPSGPDCSGTPELLTFLGTDSYASFNTKYGESNEFKIRFMSGSEEGILLYGASQYRENTVPQSLFYLALKDGSVHFGMYNEPDVYKSLSLELSEESWNTVTLILHPQKAELRVSGKNLDHTIRTKFDEVDMFAKNTLYIGGVKDLTGLEHVNENFEADVPTKAFIGQVSQLELNQGSLMDSLKSLVKVSADGAPSSCGVSPCTSGACYGDGMCRCDNDLRSGDFCENTTSFEPMQISEGYVAYHKHFDVGKTLVLKFSSPLINTERDAEILRINTRFIEDKEESLVLKLSDFTFTTGSTKTLILERKMNHIIINNGDEVTNKHFSSDTRLDDEIFIGLGESNFTGKIFSMKMDGEELVPSHGKGLSQTSYPPCYFDPCLNGAECIETSDTEYTCNCTAGHTGPVCGELIDMCEPNPCNDTSRCFSVEGVSYLCKPCPRGYHGYDCQEKAFCDLLTPCTHGDLVGNCTETEEKYFCECGDGKQRNDCDLSDTCTQVQCLNNATCVEENDEFECQCNEAFEGRYCEIPVDNCAEDTCQNGGTCVSLFDERKYFCLCAFGYTGDHCEIALDMCENEPCQNGGKCSTVGGMFVCECPEPFFGHDCSNSPCDATNCNAGRCELVGGSPVCSCDAGYTGDNCGQDVNECLDENVCTKGQGRCSNSFGDYQCDCYPGFEGKDCEINIDDCTADSCNGNGFCMDGYDTFTCLCNALYSGEFCEEKSNMCSPDPCQNGANCYNYGVDYFCICPQGWEGVNCSVNSDDCALNRCEHGARCVDELNSYSCDCDGRYTGPFCERDVDECANNSPCLNGANCTNTIGGFQCECPEFYTGDLCEVSLGECYGNPCQNGGECHELGVVGEGRECRCVESWTGDDCQIRVTECDINPCQNEGTCSITDQGYVCECKYPFSGPACNTKIIVPRLASAESYVSFETSIVDISAGFEFRFRPESSGFVFHLVYSNFFLNALYTENNDLVFTANLDGRVHFSTARNLSPAEWNRVHIKANGKSINITVNENSDVMTLKTTQLKSILRKRHQFYIGDAARKNSFVGCFYDLGNDLGTNGIESHDVEYCDEGNTCVAGHLGPCGEGGQCNELGHCDCPLGRHGKYCQADRATRNPSFNRDGYMLLASTDVDSYTLSLAAQGTGAVFVGYDKKNREMVSLVIDSTSIKLAGSSQETIYIKGYDGAWMDLTILLDISEGAVSVQLGTGEEMMVFFQGTKKLSNVYLGGSATFSHNFRGCFTELQVNGKEPQFEEEVNVRECAMEGCYEDACKNSVNDYNKCVSSGPRYFSCICGHNYVGEKCDVMWNRQTPRFNGNSFLKFVNPDNSTSGDLMLSIVFKVTGKSGVLFITEPSEMHADYIEIGVSRGRLYLTYELGAGPAHLKGPRRVDDGKWHFLHMTLQGKHAILMVDRWASEVVSPGQRNVLNVGPYLYLGGSPSHPGITGCVESLSVKDEPMTMSDTIASSNIDYCEDNVPENSIYKLKYRLK